MPSLCVFANFFIDNEERLQRMKDSFFSFIDVNPKEWRINIRGRLRAAAGDFLRSHLGERLALFYLESSRGWFYDSKKAMKNASSDYVFFWIEDHICLVSPDVLSAFICEMEEYNVEYSNYSFLHAYQNFFTEFGLSPVQGSYLSCSTLTTDSFRRINDYLGRDFYLVSCTSISKLDVFYRILKSNKPILRRWSHMLPFNFEKLSRDNIFESIRFGQPKIELFCCIDDDHGIEGYSLVSRGRYPQRISRENLKKLELVERNLSSFYSRGSFIPFGLRCVLKIKLCKKLFHFSRRVYWSVPDWLR